MKTKQTKSKIKMTPKMKELALSMAEYLVDSNEMDDFQNWCLDAGLDPKDHQEGHIYSTAREFLRECNKRKVSP